MTDDQVIYARQNMGKLSVAELAAECRVSYDTMMKALKGYSYKHLNFKHPPRL